MQEENEAKHRGHASPLIGAKALAQGLGGFYNNVHTHPLLDANYLQVESLRPVFEAVYLKST